MCIYPKVVITVSLVTIHHDRSPSPFTHPSPELVLIIIFYFQAVSTYYYVAWEMKTYITFNRNLYKSGPEKHFLINNKEAM